MQRLISAAVLVAVVFVVTRYMPALVFLLMVVVILLVAVREFCALAARRGFIPQMWAAAAGAALLALAYFDHRLGVGRTAALLTVALPLLSLTRKDQQEDRFGNLVMTLFAALFLGLLLGSTIALRMLPGEDGHDLPFLLLLIVAASDTGAYYGGRLLGRRPLAPQLSPRKTVEGLLVGLGAAVGAAFLARAWFMHRLGVADCIILGLLLALVGCGGDLVESALKRWAGAKDSSDLIPGHGGVLDRVDALIFAAPVLFYYHQFMGVWGS